MINGYGPTERTVCASTGDILPGQVVSVGRPLATMQIYLLDTHGHPVAGRLEGEIDIGGVGVARGCLNQPELTPERFLPDPFGTQPETRLFKTGDLGRRLPIGEIEFLAKLWAMPVYAALCPTNRLVEALCRFEARNQPMEC